MKTFLSFVKKEFYHIFRDLRTMLILLAMPVVQILLFGFAISTEVKNTKVAVLMPNAETRVLQAVEALDRSVYFDVTRRVTSSAEIDRLFRRGEIGLAVCFPERLSVERVRTGETGIQVIADGCEPNQARMVTGYATAAIGGTLQKLFRLQAAPPIKIETRMLFNPQAKSAYNFVPGVMGMVLLIICAMMTSVSIVREKETGTMEVLLASPVSPAVLIVAKAVPYFILSCVNLASILLLCRTVFHVPVAGSLFLLLAVSGLYILLSLMLGLLISTVVRTQMAAVLLSGMGLIMPTMILSGLMFPIESMPEWLQYISSIVPARWFISAVRKVMIEGVEGRFVLKEVMILAGMTLVLLAAGVKKFKVRLS